MGQVSAWRREKPVVRAAWLVMTLALVMGVSGLMMSSAEARSGDRRVNFRLVVENPDDGTEPEVRARRHQEVARMAAERIEKRLEVIGVGDYRVRVLPSNDLEVNVFGRHSAEAIRSAVIPPGRMEIRAVVVDETPWMDLEEMLPEGVEVRVEPGSFQTDRLYLYSPSAESLHRFLSRVSLGGVGEVMIYPHQEGWRTLNLGAVLATEQDLNRVELKRTPSAIPFVSTHLKTEVTQEIRAAAALENARHLAVILDGEVVSLIRFSGRTFSSEMILEVPEFLRTTEARNGWALQVAGRLAAPLPITLAELE